MAALALAGCTGSGAGERRLETLRTDPMAAYDLPGAVHSRTNEVAGGTSDVSSPSSIRTTFTVPPGEVPAAIEAIAGAATDAGWSLVPRQPTGYTGDRTIDDLRAQILIAGLDADDTVWVEITSRGA